MGWGSEFMRTIVAVYEWEPAAQGGSEDGEQYQVIPAVVCQVKCLCMFDQVEFSLMKNTSH